MTAENVTLKREDFRISLNVKAARSDVERLIKANCAVFDERLKRAVGLLDKNDVCGAREHLYWALSVLDSIINLHGLRGEDLSGGESQ